MTLNRGATGQHQTGFVKGAKVGGYSFVEMRLVAQSHLFLSGVGCKGGLVQWGKKKQTNKDTFIRMMLPNVR